MGITLSSVCCTCYNARMPTEEDDFLGIRNEVRQKNKQLIPLPFQEYLNRRSTFSDFDSSLNFLENPQIDFITSDNRVMQTSAILRVQEIPQIPTPTNDGFEKIPHRVRRSISVSNGYKHGSLDSIGLASSQRISLEQRQN